MARKQLQTLTEPMYYVLLSLIEPLHGYGIMQKVTTMTDGRVKVGPGTLYNLIARFEQEGLVARVPSEEKKKVYVLTHQGHEMLAEEWHRLNQLVADGRRIMEARDER